MSDAMKGINAAITDIGQHDPADDLPVIGHARRALKMVAMKGLTGGAVLQAGSEIMNTMNNPQPGAVKLDVHKTVILPKRKVGEMIIETTVKPNKGWRAKR